MAEAAIVRLRLEIEDGRSSLVLDYFFCFSCKSHHTVRELNDFLRSWLQ